MHVIYFRVSATFSFFTIASTNSNTPAASPTISIPAAGPTVATSRYPAIQIIADSITLDTTNTNCHGLATI
jgi:hypothetical protein